MQINQLTIHYTRTQSLPSYSNVKPGVTITATLEPGEDVFECYNVLMNDARELVHGEIDDALEQAEQSPKFTEEPLYWFAFNNVLEAVVILPDSVEHSTLNKHARNDPNHNWRADWYTSRTLQRHASVTANAEKEHPHHVFIDCSDGDLSRIPPFPAPPEPDPADEPKYRAVDYSDLADDDDDDRPENERFPDEEE